VIPSNVILRPITPKDQQFLYRVYVGTRQEEMALVSWSQAEKENFLRMQFHAQHKYYQEQFPQARFDLILQNEEPVGRLYVSRTEEEIRIVDIAILPEHRNRGVGSALLQDLLEEAAADGRPVRIHVEKVNPARRLYERLGFRSVQDRGVYILMEK
jgi:ribosomal protein S18 acetylase RimI-like enzyme